MFTDTISTFSLNFFIYILLESFAHFQPVIMPQGTPLPKADSLIQKKRLFYDWIRVTKKIANLWFKTYLYRARYHTFSSFTFFTFLVPNWSVSLSNRNIHPEEVVFKEFFYENSTIYVPLLQHCSSHLPDFYWAR